MQTISSIIQVALGLGFVIFVHELGHFLVAKMCGVRCDKFFVGFDIGGIKLSRKWGETEYGIGVLPLGGYVKMYGQEDNAAAIAEEIEASKTMEGSPDAKEVTGPGGEKVWIHKRSYLAKSVPQRMAIISAGVIMNVIFAFLMAIVAFGVGVPEPPAIVGSTIPGLPAWEAGLRTGDRMLSINDVQDPGYQQLVEEVILGDPEAGVRCRVERVDGTTSDLVIKPMLEGPTPQIGLTPSVRPYLAPKDAVLPNSPAAELGEDGFQDGDQIVAVNGEPIASYADLVAVLETNAANSLTYTLVRGGKPPTGDPFGDLEGGEQVEITVGPNPMERLGIVPQMGPITAIMKGSPAEMAGIEVGDKILGVDSVRVGRALEGEQAIDPINLPARLAAIAERDEQATITVARGSEEIELSIKPRVVTWNTIESPDAPQALDALGVAYELSLVVDALIAGSPASQTDLQPNDQIVGVTFLSDNANDGLRKPVVTLESDKPFVNWGGILSQIQNRSNDFRVRLDIKRGDAQEPTQVELSPASVEDAYTSTRGVKIQRLQRLRIAESFSEQVELGVNATVRALTTVLRFLQGLGSGQVSIKGAGGPIAIATVAGEAANQGFGALLMSLVMLSANLAVLNFLPIPVLDGGHMVFLLYEGITGRPVNERVMIALQTIGLFLLLGLMLFVTTMDISRLLTWFM